MSAESPAPAVTCPPHYWLIASDEMGRDRWSCHKCGLVRADARRPTEARRLSNVCTWGRDEVALVEVD